jgi:8-oxo-dGTP pyrophosphatase MutT (NUDIX family)
MKTYHRDKETRIVGERHAGIVLHNNKLLLMHRIKHSFEYWVFPGGHRDKGETGEQTVIREIFEETGITVELPKLVITFSDKVEPNTNYYYLCEWKEGDKPYLNGEEKEANPNVDLYDPMWVGINKVESMNVLPQFAKEWLIKYLSKI